MYAKLKEIEFDQLSEEMQDGFHGPEMCMSCDNFDDFEVTLYLVDDGVDIDSDEFSDELEKFLEKTTGQTRHDLLYGGQSVIVINKCANCGSYEVH